MEATVRLYTLNYDEAKTYMWAAIFVVCNLVLPQVFRHHLLAALAGHPRWSL